MARTSATAQWNTLNADHAHCRRDATHDHTRSPATRPGGPARLTSAPSRRSPLIARTSMPGAFVAVSAAAVIDHR